MKKIVTIVVIALFTIGATAQESKVNKKSNTKECCATKNRSAEETAKCEEKCKAEAKVSVTGGKVKSVKNVKSCCAKKV